MIQIRRVHIEEVRGIRRLTLDLDGRSFCIYGPNGSGKSGVVDAIEFALTGEISRLAGTGTGGLSVRAHGPHIDKRDYPDSSFVSLDVEIPHLGKSATLTRSVKNPRDAKIEPADEDVKAVLAEVARHPEITLSRREVIKFILTEATTRSRDVQTLLKLDEIDHTRSILKAAANKIDRAQEAAQSEVRSASDDLRRHLDTATLTPEEVLSPVNKRRRVLGLPEIGELGSDTSLSEGVADGAPRPDRTLNKESALRDLESLQQELGDGLDVRTRAQTATALENLCKLEEDGELLSALRQRTFVEAGLGLVEGPYCPLCDSEWDVDALRTHLEEKIARYSLAEAVQNTLLAAGGAIANEIARAVGPIQAVAKIAKAAAASEFSTRLEAWARELCEFKAKLSSADGMMSVKERLEAGWSERPANALEDLRDLGEKVGALPDESATGEARTFLAIAQDRLEKYRRSRREASRRTKASSAAKATYSAYCEASEERLAALYSEVEEQFSSLYRTINSDDEGGFAAKLKPAAGKLDLSVDFYGRGMFPPGAYHSEGHQDGMGVCLYLALMKRVLGEHFRLAVLDDVVMSVDAQHRKQFCKLLKDEFPNTQFVITTHDQLWAQQMRSAGLVTSKAAVAFRGWKVDMGPLVHAIDEVWEEINSDVGNGKISAASATLRRHLEYVLREIADKFGAPVPYRSDDGWDLGDLLPSVLRRYMELLGKAAKAAQSWGDDDTGRKVRARKESLSSQAAACGGEQWMINKAIHYNEWGTFSKEDFEPVVLAFKTLLAEFRCSACGSWLYGTPKKGQAEALRCDCNDVSLNLKEK